jgi:hypothetical protein
MTFGVSGNLTPLYIFGYEVSMTSMNFSSPAIHQHDNHPQTIVRSISMAQEGYSSEATSILASALGEANDARHLHAGGDHVFVALLNHHYGTSSGVLFRYEDLEDEARAIMRKLTPKWILRKHGRARLATSSEGLMQAIAVATEIAGSKSTFNALNLLEGILRVEEPNFMELLRRLKIAPSDILTEIKLCRELSV